MRTWNDKYFRLPREIPPTTIIPMLTVVSKMIDALVLLIEIPKYLLNKYTFNGMPIFMGKRYPETKLNL
jgi:hypothetical protein